MRLTFQDLVDYFESKANRFTAPYGILSGTATTKSGRKYKSITFGVARYLDAEVRYFSPNFILVDGQGALAYKIEGKYTSIEELKKAIDQF